MMEKPTGPIWIDFEHVLLSMPVGTLIRCANLSMNRLDMRDVGEVMADLGMQVGMQFQDDEKAKPATA